MGKKADAEEGQPVGRPLKYKTVAELEMAIQRYFDECDPHIQTRLEATGISGKGETMFAERKVLTDQRPYTMAGLARALGLTRQGLINYVNRDEFFDTLYEARQRCEEYAEGQLFGPYSNGAKFNLSNNYDDWRDKREVDNRHQAVVEFVNDVPRPKGDNA